MLRPYAPLGATRTDDDDDDDDDEKHIGC